MEDDFLNDYFILYIEWIYLCEFSIVSFIDYFLDKIQCREMIILYIFLCIFVNIEWILVWFFIFSIKF